jgi:hypothetical protein
MVSRDGLFTRNRRMQRVSIDYRLLLPTALVISASI